VSQCVRGQGTVPSVQSSSVPSATAHLISQGKNVCCAVESGSSCDFMCRLATLSVEYKLSEKTYISRSNSNVSVYLDKIRTRCIVFYLCRRSTKTSETVEIMP
jgi:hypothetical protein